MSCDIDSDSFHGTKAGGKRKTVSSRRAYRGTPKMINRKLLEAIHLLDSLP